MIIHNLSMPVKKSNSETKSKRNPKCIVSSCFSNFKFDNQSDKKVKVIGIDIDFLLYFLLFSEFLSHATQKI